MNNADFSPFKPIDYGKFLVISLGTGSAKQEEKFTAQESAKWGVLGWLYNRGSTPLIDVFSQASADMVDFHTSILFQALRSEKNYLRIQVIIISFLLGKINYLDSIDHLTKSVGIIHDNLIPVIKYIG